MRCRLAFMSLNSPDRSLTWEVDPGVSARKNHSFSRSSLRGFADRAPRRGKNMSVKRREFSPARVAQSDRASDSYLRGRSEGCEFDPRRGLVDFFPLTYWARTVWRPFHSPPASHTTHPF